MIIETKTESEILDEMLHGAKTREEILALSVKYQELAERQRGDWLAKKVVANRAEAKREKLQFWLFLFFLSLPCVVLSFMVQHNINAGL